MFNLIVQKYKTGDKTKLYLFFSVSKVFEQLVAMHEQWWAPGSPVQPQPGYRRKAD